MLQTSAAWNTLLGFVPLQSLLLSAQEETGQRLFVNDALLASQVFVLILGPAQRCAWSVESLSTPEILGVWCQSEQVFRQFSVALAWYCLLYYIGNGIFCDMFSFSSLQNCLCTQVSGHGSCPSRHYLFLKYFFSHTCHTPQNIVYSISPFLFCEPGYILEM